MTSEAKVAPVPAANATNTNANTTTPIPSAASTTPTATPAPAAASTTTTTAATLSQPLHPLPRVCGFCGRGGAVSRCSKCMSTYYCTQQCQAAHWKTHKQYCIKVENSSAGQGGQQQGGGNHTHSAAASAAAISAASASAQRTFTIPPNSAAVNPPPSSSASTRSSVATSTMSSMHSSGKENGTISVTAQTSTSHSHSHSHGANGHHHPGYTHQCSNPNCPHHAHTRITATGTDSATIATAIHAAPQAMKDAMSKATLAAATNVARTPNHTANSTSLPSSSPSLTSTGSSTSSTSSNNGVSNSSVHVHSQTSYSPVPVSNVSASSRHIYVPPCRPILHPSFISYPSLYNTLASITPPLSCIHGFHMNLLFSPSDTIRILYGDLNDSRHILQSLCDLQTKMKAWKKKHGNSGVALNPNQKYANINPLYPPTASGASLPTPPSVSSQKNPNIGIEFHLNDHNPHVLARSILFLVSTYMSSALMNHNATMNNAAMFGILMLPHCVHAPSVPQQQQQQQQQNGATTPAYPQPSPFPIPVLSSYSHWTPSDHWSYLFSLYGCYQIPYQFIARLRETLELLIRLTGSTTIWEATQNAAASSSQSTPHHQQQHPSNLSSHDSSQFSLHPYTFFLHLPSLTLSIMLPIWKNWEEVCRRAMKEEEERREQKEKVRKQQQEKKEADSTTTLPYSRYHLPPVTPLFTRTDITSCHPSSPELCTLLENYYRTGSIEIKQRYYNTTHVMRREQEWKEIRQREDEEDEKEMKEQELAQQQAAANNNNTPDNSFIPLSQLYPLHELYPPSIEEHADTSSYILNPTLVPMNYSAFQCGSTMFGSTTNPATAASATTTLHPAGVNGVSSAASAAATLAASSIPSIHSPPPNPCEIDAVRVAEEISLKWLYTREPFSLLLPKIETPPTSSSTTSTPSSDEISPVTLCMDLMSKMSHALFWVASFQPQGNVNAPTPTTILNQQQQQPSTQQSIVKRIPYVRLYFYNHDLFFHLHTYDFLYDRILIYHLPEYVGIQSLILMGRQRMKNVESLLECNMNFPSCLVAQNIQQAAGGNGNGSGTELTAPQPLFYLPDLTKFCLLSLNANLKLLRNIFGWDLQSYTYPSYPTHPITVLRFSVCDYSLDLTAPPGHVSDGYRVMNDWFITAIQPILFNEQFLQATDSRRGVVSEKSGTSGKNDDEKEKSSKDEKSSLLNGLPSTLTPSLPIITANSSPPLTTSSSSPLDPLHLSNFIHTAPRSISNLRTFCLLIGLLIKQGHLDQPPTRHRMLQLFSTLFVPGNYYNSDYLFTSFLTHIGLLKSELLPLMYLLLAPQPESTAEVLNHNVLFFKGIWQLELISMKFESLIPLFLTLQKQRKSEMDAVESRSCVHQQQQEKEKQSKKKGEKDTSSAPLLPFDPCCRLCGTLGINHQSHRTHGLQYPTQRESLLALCFVTDAKSCPTPINLAAGTNGTSGNTTTTSTSTSSTSSSSTSSSTSSGASPENPLSWIHYRGVPFLSWLRARGRTVQLIDLVDIDWSSGIVTAWCNRTYVNYVRKCSAYAQVCVIDFEQMRVAAPPRSVVHLKTMRSMNIR